MVQTIKAYKLSWKQTLKAYKSNMGINSKKYWITIININKPKCPRTFSYLFQNDSADMTLNDHYKRAPIILEMTVGLESLEGTFIPEVFKERTLTKLLNLMGNVYEDFIREFFANTIVEGNHINCWLIGREFSIS